jgi:ribulose-5-phosphate 4-epimerase/fuculose-1-phosphate aldolase
MIASLGDKHVLVLRNHGIAVCERDIPCTFGLLWTVQRAAEIQCQAAALRGTDIVLEEAVRQRCRDAVSDLGSGIRVARLLFDATVRRMRANAPHG